MQLRTVQWNIGGAHIRGLQDDPNDAGSYIHEDLTYIVEKLKEYKPDIITLQESHADEQGSQAKTIAEALSLPYFLNDPYDTSHIDTSQKLCQSIISRFPIKNHSFSLFFNPHYRKVWEDGTVWASHDKGISTATIEVGNVSLTVQTLHLIPFRKFDVDMSNETGKKVISSIESLIEKEKTPYLIQGDFNLSEIKSFFPSIFSQELREAAEDAPTTPKGKTYDHVLFNGLKHLSAAFVDVNVLADHYPVVCDFEL